MKQLIIVESPTKGQKIQEYLGDNYIVLSSKGHIADLAKGGTFGIGVDIKNDFKPRYILSDDRIDILNSILDAAKQVDRILIASDPDREGEAIAWHLQQRLEDVGKPIKRMVFNEIKKTALQKSIKELRDINMPLFHSQEARRILDRLVGFNASPFLINFFGPNLSAGRVQSVVTRMIIDREDEIKNFIPKNYWNVFAHLKKQNQSFIVKCSNKITSAEMANEIFNQLNSDDCQYKVSEVLAEEEKKYPDPPLVTSTMQRIMSKEYGFNAERTMKAAQSLYEGGYCTYIRTDSVRASDDSIADVRDWLIGQNLEIPKKPNSFKNKDGAQDAHECIRPSDLSLNPNDNYEIVTPDEKKLYEIIWKYFVASQMNPAIYNTLKVTVTASTNTSLQLKASGKALKSEGFLKILGVVDNSKIDIPNLIVGDILILGDERVKVEKKQTQPPPRYSEDKLIKELVNKNIGRPATYADLLSKITVRNYVTKVDNIFYPTELGKKITNILVKYFSFMNYDYTAKLEQQLDDIESGKINHIEMLKKFYPDFKKEIDSAYVDHGGIICEKCNLPMITRVSKIKNEKFLACSGFPRCKNTKSVL